MLDFKEDFLQFVWQNKLLLPKPLITVSGKEIFVLKHGELNKDAGPDFFNGQIKVNEIILAGNIEIHLQTSDWLRHKHTDNKAYNNLILHVVFEHDVDLKQNQEFNVEVLELKNLIHPSSIENFKGLINSNFQLPCHNQLSRVNDLKFISWLDRMVIERMETKITRLEKWFEELNGDFVSTFYFSLLRNFGFRVNAQSFELLAKQLPVQILLKHSDNLLQLESLLLGTAGLLDNHFKDAYILQLQNEFEFLKNKYKLISLKKEIFKFSRLRPANFPTIRLAQFAKLIYENSDLLSSPHLYFDSEKLKTKLNVDLSGYWQHHYNVDGQSTLRDLRLGQSSIENLIINTFAPFSFFYSKKKGDENYSEAAMILLQNCKFEKNTITKFYAQKQTLLKDASNSQALINLFNNYCKHKQCLRCGIASAILKG